MNKKKNKKIKIRKVIPSHLVVTTVVPSKKDYRRLRKDDIRRILEDE